MHSDNALAGRLLEVIKNDILPLTEAQVAAGNKIFGAALLNKDSLDTFLAGTNNETENPLWHGEMHTLKQFYEIPSQQRPATSDLIFLSTHEPCSLCLSAITWCGFDNFYYLFSYEDTRDEFAIPHDLKIMSEVFGREDYRSKNEFWNSCSIEQLIERSDNTKKIQANAKAIKKEYTALSSQYQASKSTNEIPLN